MVTTRRSSMATGGKAPAGTPTRRRTASGGNNSTSSTPKAGAKATAATKTTKNAGAAAAPVVGSSKAVRLAFKALGIYGCFLYWGVLQEKVSTTRYESPQRGVKPGKFEAMIVVNAFVAVAAALVGLALHAVNKGTTAPFATFWKPALSNTIASPIGYLSLRSISYPLMILVKNCKLIPVMIVGAVVNGVRYKSYEYVAVALISMGVILFAMKGGGAQAGGHGGHGAHGAGMSQSYSVGGSSSKTSSSPLADAIAADNIWQMLTAVAGLLASNFTLKELGGLGLAVTNLLVDGFTNAEQDRINQKYKVSPYYMMAMVNLWSLLFASTFLVGEYLYNGTTSQLATTVSFIGLYPAILMDLVQFSFMNAFGQVFIYSVIDEFGSLVSVTITVTRKMITLFISIFRFGHVVYWWQWIGVGFVFAGLCLKIFWGGGGHGHGAAAAKKKK